MTEQAKTTMFIAFLVIILGYAGHIEYESQLINELVTTCEKSGGTTPSVLGQKCKTMIDNAERQGYQVITDEDAAMYWVEAKK
jgi:hypothetical protein